MYKRIKHIPDHNKDNKTSKQGLWNIWKYLDPVTTTELYDKAASDNEEKVMMGIDMSPLRAQLTT